MPVNHTQRSRPRERGISIVELSVVIAIIIILSAVAVPRMISARRMLRSSAVPREVMSQLRLVRQEAMSQRQAMTFQYDNTNKQIVVIDHQASGRALLTATGYPNTVGSIKVRTIALYGTGLPAAELAYGVPTGAQAGALDDTTSLTALGSSPSTINITFQPDGSVVSSTGAPVNFALYFYNVNAATSTAAAVSVLGAGGRVKIWRFDSNANKYVE